MYCSLFCLNANCFTNVRLLIHFLKDVLDMSGSIRDSIADYGLSLVIPDTDSPGKCTAFIQL